VEIIDEERGRLVWRHREELPLHLIHGENASLAGIDSYPGYFDDAPIPESELSLRQPDQSAEDEIDPQPETAMGEEQVAMPEQRPSSSRPNVQNIAATFDGNRLR
jgi:hypothetical protein